MDESRGRRKNRWTWVVSLVIVGLLMGWGVGQVVPRVWMLRGQGGVTLPGDEPHRVDAGDARPHSVVDVVEQAGPSVAKIVTRTPATVEEWFFAGVGVQEGIGSGVIIDEAGYIVTNNHVVEGAERIYVMLPDGRTFEGEVVGIDPLTDLAVLKVPPKGKALPALELADSSALRVGQEVVAIGNPFGYDFTVTSGIVSALRRPLPIDVEHNVVLENTIQTDASINPGNSGGPLLDLQARVVGINTAIASQGTGIGFAIPSNTVKKVARDLIDHGKPIRLGVLGGTLTPAIARAVEEQHGKVLGVERGAFVTNVGKGTPAAVAGIESGDVIVEFNERPIGGIEALSAELAKVSYGDRFDITVVRSGQRHELSAVLK